MKKLILTSAVLFITLSSFAKEGNKCSAKCTMADHKECKKDATCSKTKSTTDAMLKEDKACCKKVKQKE
ncbi:MAG: hypothetical protein IPP27_14435 [Bacteroidetes bacterium]|nr:hypothetical protein [Bacteroidota bacterium]